MNTVLRSGAFKVRIYVDDHLPAHVHVGNPDGQAKINLEGDGPELVWAFGMKKPDIRRALALVTENREKLLTDWRSIHGA